MKVWWALISRETRTLLPWWLTFAALVVLTPVFVLWMQPGVALEPRSSLLDGMHDTAFIAMLLSFMVGHGLVAPEWRQQHIEFLDGLPVRRVEVFGAKVIAGLAPCSALVIGSAVGDFTLSLLLGHPDAMGLAHGIVLGHVVVGAAMLGGFGGGLLLSWLGGLGWGVVVLMLTGGLFLRIAAPPVRTWLPMLGTYGALDWDLGTATHPLGPAVGWAIVGAVTAALSGVLFGGPGSMFTSRGSWLTAISRWAVLGCGGSAMLLLGLLSLLLVAFTASEELLEPVRSLPSGTLRVLYHPSNIDRAQELADELATLSAEVGARVGNPDPMVLDVELMGAPSNHAGLFTGGKIRVRHDADRFVVAHELAHAHAFAIAGPTAWRHASHTRFFDEGLASWVAAELSGDEEIPAAAGWIRRTDQARFEWLVDDSQLQAEQDLAQAYPLGQAFVAALVDEAGTDAPACVLRQLRDVGGRPVAGLALWVQLAADCGFSLDGVVDAWEDALDRRAETLAPVLPKLHARPIDGGVALHVTDDSGSEWPLICRFRDDVSTPVNRYEHVTTDAGGTCRVPRTQLSGQTYGYQLGFVPPGVDEPVFWPWVEAPVP